MGIYEVILTQKYFNQTIINRFHYVGSGTPAAVQPSFGLLYAMGLMTARLSGGVFPGDTLAGQVQGIQSGNVQFIAAYCRNLYSNTDFYESPFPTPPQGTRTGEGMPPFVAWGFYGSRVRTDIRRAMKRFVGVPEDLVSPGGTIASAVFGALNNVAGELGQTLTYDDEGNTLTFAPCVLGLEEYTTPSGKRAYRNYATEAAQLAHVAQGGVYNWYTTVRSQTSRQYGRGV